MKKKISVPAAFTVLFIFTCISTLHAQKNEQELSQIILHKDSLFWLGYNNCDTGLNGQFIAEDVEFYHDKGGITNGKHNLVMSLQNNLCSNPDWRLRREVVPGTLKLFPLHRNDTIYGAVLMGEHYFYINEKGKPEFRDGHASFTHLWLKENGEWKMKRILSYDHHPAAPINQRKAITLPPATLKQYTGTYKGPQTTNLLIQSEKGALVITGKNKTFLYPETTNLFFAQDRDLTFEFVRDTKGKVTSLKVREHGAVVEELALVKPDGK